MKYFTWLCLFKLFAGTAIAQEPKEILLWAGVAPGSEGKTAAEQVRITVQGDHVITGINKPSITPYLPSAEKNAGVAIIIAPGGGLANYGSPTKDTIPRNGLATMVLQLLC
ncbi:MAG: hypothetical protein M3N14_13180 [Bacteroidota bacterium]|nr:hypothetical protein [Bacteroidota bacterium]